MIAAMRRSLTMGEKFARQSRSFIQDLRGATILYRSHNGLSQEELGARLGVSRSAIGGFERGDTLLGEEPLDRLIALMRSPLAVMADELRNLADFINSPDIEEDMRRKRLFRQVPELQVLMESLRIIPDNLDESSK